jgi:hypothetical protein
MGRSVVRRPWFFTLLALPVVLGLAGCDPVPHPSFTVRESPDSAVTFQLLAGDASHAVVTATAAGETVPGPGVWRVDRSDGSVDELPAGGPSRISRDGQRVLLSGPTRLWSAGSVLTPPSSLLSENLTFALFVDTDGQVKTWETATGTVTSVETGFPRPPGTTEVIPKGVSDDGRTVQYELRGSSRIERFVDLDADVVVERPNADAGTLQAMDRFVLAARGDAFLHIHQVGGFDTVCRCLLYPTSWAELVRLPSGTVSRRYTNTVNDMSLSRGFVSANGRLAWVYKEHFQADCIPPHPPRPASGCITKSTTVAFRQEDARSFNTGPDFLGAMDTSGRGRFLAYDRFVNDPFFQPFTTVPVQLLDWTSGFREGLASSVDYTETDDLLCEVLRSQPAPCRLPALSVNAQLSDDGRVVATTTSSGKGWYEYEAEPAAP